MAVPSSVSRSLPCANGGNSPEPSPCGETATKVCSGCFLVQYCSPECLKAHWRVHKLDCKSPLMKTTWRPSWEMEGRTPSFISGDNAPLMTSHGQRKYLWGNVPAFDILNLKDNEGVDTSANLRLLFAASGDLRNVVKTVTELPASYPGSCDVVVNDMDADIVARNAILLLTALHLEPEEAAPIMLHIWYSVLIPERMLQTFQDVILPIFQDVCSKIQQKPERSLQAKTWTYGSSSLRLILQKCQWDAILQYFGLPAGLTATRARDIRIATTLAPNRVDYVERALFSLPPAWRVAMLKFRKDGILLPFGVPRNEFDTPNPTFFRSRDFWPMMDSADPLEGWTIEDIMRYVPFAKNDVYGGMSLYVIEMLTVFCQRLKGLKVSFVLFQVNATKLPDILCYADLAQQGFDRIEVSNISDICHLGPGATLRCLSPLLRHWSKNPHATLITLFLNAVHETRTPDNHIATLRTDIRKAAKYLPKISFPELLNLRGATTIQFADCQMLFWDFDSLFAEYMVFHNFPLLGKKSGLVMKEKNTVIPKWPLRLRDNATQEEFDLLRASGHRGGERYVEWKFGNPGIDALVDCMETTSLAAKTS